MSLGPTKGDAEVPIQVFGGLVTLESADSLPAGVSPDCSDVVFTPGSVTSRPGLVKQFATPLGAVAITYGKTYVDPTGVKRNLYLDLAGNLWMENVTTGAVPTVIATTTPGCLARSTTAFGREYIAISDGFIGTDIPLQYDGANLDRVTQDGPGAPPTISNLIIPPVNVSPSASPISVTITEVDPENPDPSSGFFTQINVYTSSSITGVSTGDTVTITGTSTPFDGIWGPITGIFSGIPNSLIQISAFIPSGTPFWTGTATMTVNQGALRRQSNVVTGQTATPHQLQPGYQVQISNAQASLVGTSLNSIVINNEDNPGIATVVVNLAAGQFSHGLLPQNQVSITGVQATAVGAGILSIARAGGIVTVVMNAATGLTPNAVITLSGVTDVSFNVTTGVINVTTTTLTGDTFTFLQSTYPDAAPTGGGSVSLNWPIPQTAQPTYFEVLSCPTQDSFQIAINYSDATWITGEVRFAWDGTFFVQSVPGPTTFTYQQYGPDAVAAPVSGSIIASPFGQASPGQHQMQVLFLTRQGAITAPSPPVSFVANGGQYLSVSNIPIGPSDVVGRIIAFTGAQGAYFFYIPSTPTENGQIVGTPTQINDNTTSSIVLDFADNTLFAATAISVQGNNLANQIVLDGALGFAYYGSRLMTWGQRNVVQGGGAGGGLLNMSFDGGFIAALPNNPLGWQLISAGGSLGSGHYGQGWQITVVGDGTNYGFISQSFYEDAYGAPIAVGNTLYKLRVWLKLSAPAPNLIFTAALSSASTSLFIPLNILGGIPISTTGAFYEAVFPVKTPQEIPSDLRFQISAAMSSGSTVVLTVDEMNLIYNDNPVVDTIISSYANNPEGFDGVSGVFGPIDDTHAVTDMAVLRGDLKLLTRDPGGRLHSTSDNGVSEPSGWTVEEVGTNCGALSAFGMCRSQFDDATGSGGEEWIAWASASGARIYGGSQPWKISEEIQPNWSGFSSPFDPTLVYPGINMAAAHTIWAVNDPGEVGIPDTGRVIYFGLPIGDGNLWPNFVYQMDYKKLDTSEQISAADPVKLGAGGKLAATDHSRKWAPWNRYFSGAGLLYRDDSTIKLTFFAGTALGIASFGNVYCLDPGKLTDDDYGVIIPYYVTYLCPEHQEEQGLSVGSVRKQHVYTTLFIAGVGTMTVTVYVDSLSNPWPRTVTRTLNVNRRFDIGCPGTAVGERFAIKVSTLGITSGTDNGFDLSKLVIFLRKMGRSPVRGSVR